jgi:uncharacterized protein (DUF2141 family)
MTQRFYLVSIIALVLAYQTPSSAQPTPSGEIRVIVTNLRNDHGHVACGLFNGPDGFPREEKKEFRGMSTTITGNTAVCDFKAVPAGQYAATILHDENLDGKMDFNMLGIPTKGYGFSNGAKATLSPPSFDAARISFDGLGTLDMPIKTVYWTKSL